MKLSRFVRKSSILNNIKLYPNQQSIRCNSNGSSVSKILEGRKDLEELFLNNNVRNILKRLTGYDPTVLFESKSLKNLKSPKYHFMTDEQLKIERDAADKRAEILLQMPPIKYSSVNEPRIFEKNPALQGYIKNKLIFVDASPGFSDEDRLIVVRDTDGTLREASRSERHRMNQAFYPIEERHMDLPKMLEPEHMKNVLERGAYKLLLENACLHFEPEDARYQEICHETYDHISKENAFESLYSTRFYGGMVYYYVYFKRADNYLFHLLENRRLDDAFHLLQLYYIVNPRSGAPIELDKTSGIKLSLFEIAQISRENELLIPIEEFLGFLKFYIEHDASDPQFKAKLELAAQQIESQNTKAEAQN